MALHGYARLEVGGTALTGDVSMGSIGGVDVSSDHVEVLELHAGAFVETAGAGGGRPRGRHELLPVRLRKRTDATTPALYRALARAERVDATFLLFDTDPVTGETRHRFTIRLEQARVSSMTTDQPDTLDPEVAHQPVTDGIELVTPVVAWVDEVHGVEFEDRVDR
ncbi:type VI secretion system tube protein Hcp [Salsipaludibacter albus]|uniref:type VI secretion system tube protein Hcp n=1 Tax=Salsipaludibacter albus TaxID=2849650 RepID=UPI001EE3B357|nr:type VI secretion system tube protein Hcp [Salsipaludibacter albus]MBY5164509.1 type VI secretion system tube protein Hcp [Salsipaludibacter albus]